MNLKLGGSGYVPTDSFHGSVKQLPADTPALQLRQYEKQGDVVAVADGTHSDHATVNLGDEGEALPTRKRAQVVCGHDLGKKIATLLGVVGSDGCFEALPHDSYCSVGLEGVQ
jgi:hypothetical protein